MSSEAPPHTQAPPAAAPAPASRFAPGLFGRTSAASGPGELHAEWTVAAMLRPAARDVLALAERPPRALCAGCEGWLCAQLLDWGFPALTAVDRDPEARATLERWRDGLAFAPSRWSVAEGEPTGTFELVIADERHRESGIGSSALRALGGRVIVICAEPAARAAAEREAGRVPSPLPAPADAEERFVRGAWALLEIEAGGDGR